MRRKFITFEMISDITLLKNKTTRAVQDFTNFNNKQMSKISQNS